MVATYREIKADILGKITRGEWRPGSPIPSELELAELYGSARATVSRAMRELVEDGLIERKRKAGSRVRLAPLRQARFDIPVTRREVEALGLAYGFALLRSEVGRAPDWLRERLGLPESAEVRRLLCLHLAGGAPYQHEDRWINLDLLPQAREADFAAQAPTEWLIAQIPFSEVEIGISATAAAPEIAEQLGCRAGEPLLQVERATRWEGQAVTLVRLVHRPGYRMAARY